MVVIVLVVVSEVVGVPVLPVASVPSLVLALMLRSIVVIGVLASGLSAHKTRTDHVARLKRDLFYEYDNTIIPLKGNESLTLNIGMSMTKMDFNIHGELTIDHWIRAMWNDYRLSWDPREYGDVDVIRVPTAEVWRPDLKIYNELEYGPVSQFDSTDVYSLIYPDGSVFAIPPLHNKVQCEEEDFKNWPWGEYSCNIKLGSWTVDGYKLNATLFNDLNGIDVEQLAKNSPFVFTADSFTEPSLEVKYYSCCKEPYPAVNYKFHIQRQFLVGDDGSVERNPNPKPLYNPKKYKIITPNN